MNEVIYRPASLDEIYQLRFAVLRPGQTVVKLHFPGDDAAPPMTWHFGGFVSQAEAARTVACLTLFANEFEGASAIQLRGMAVAPELRSQGIGGKLLASAEGAAREDPRVTTRLWWCNARVGAIRFYERNGWRTVSEEFMIPGVGPHKRMVKEQ